MRTRMMLAVLALAFCESARADAPAVRHAIVGESGQKTPEISTEELAKILADGSALVLDTRPHLEYAISHIPGAKNVAARPGVAMSMYVSDVAEIGRLAGGKKD